MSNLGPESPASERLLVGSVFRRTRTRNRVPQKIPLDTLKRKREVVAICYQGACRTQFASRHGRVSLTCGPSPPPFQALLGPHFTRSAARSVAARSLA